MRFEDIYEKVGDVPFITKNNARLLYDLILNEKFEDVLELGIAHGTATCYLAAAIQELGNGKVVAIDLISAKKQFIPSAEEQLKRVGLESFAEVHMMQTGYNWFLHDETRRNSDRNVCNEKYDLCIIDGPKNWAIDGFAFF